MKLFKGDIVEVNHTRKGKFKARVVCDCNTKTDDFISLILLSKSVYGLKTKEKWIAGDRIDCRISFLTRISVDINKD